MTRHIFVILIVIFSTADLVAQDVCSEWYLKEKKKQIKKAKYSQKAILQYELAMCYKNVNDSIFKSLLNASLEQNKLSYDNPIKEQRIRRLFVAAQASFELGDFKSAEVYFNKSFAALSPTDDLKPKYLFDFGVTLYNLKKYPDALLYLTSFKNIQYHDPSVDKYIDECKKQINSR